MNKLLTLIPILFLILIIMPINAEISCSVTTRAACSDTIILGASNYTGGYLNAHAQLANITTYEYVICCNADSISETLTNECLDNSSVFVKLSSEDNAHVEVPTQSNYPEESCIYVTNRQVVCSVNEGSCPSGRECIYSLASSEPADANLTNAHINADCDPLYQTRVCCGFENREPEMEQTYITPNETVYANETLEGYCLATDVDLDTVRFYYNWYLNGTLNESGVTTYSAQNTLRNVANISNTITQRGQEWILECIANDASLNSTPQNSSTVEIINHPPEKVILDQPVNDDETYINRYIFYNWSIPTDHDFDELTYDLLVARDDSFITIVTNQTSLTNNNYTEITPQDFGVYYWQVRAFDGIEYGEWSDVSNFTLVESIIITPINNNINFGTLNPSNQINTTTNTPEPFQFRNDGNTDADLRNTTTTESIWVSESLNTEFWKIRPRQTGTFNESSSIITWSNVQTNIGDLVKQLNWQTDNNTITLDIEVIVPASEPPGEKSSQITFNWGVAE
jgi:hypothetical protein